ncbi:MAG: alpha/beta hydrolase [Micromonosporaceae bacterium]
MDAPRGVLLLLAGGPGQPGPAFIPLFLKVMPEVMREYRLVMLDQRGTGNTAIDCPELQEQVGGSDVKLATPAAIQDCADSLGATRHHYTSADTVADLDALRQALGVDKWTLDGVSYGSFVAQQYGLTYPEHTTALVLDSVVTQDNADPLYTASLRGSGRVLRTACREQSCGYDPAKELATVLRRYGDAVGVLEMLIVMSIIDPKLTNPQFGVLRRLHAAASGDPESWRELLGFFQGPDGTPPQQLSAGLHLAAVCADITDMPWGDSAAPLAGRDEALHAAVSELETEEVWPFQKRTAGEQGLVANCRHWPSARPMPAPPHRTLSMPVLLLSGNRDLSTPLEWAEQQLAHTPYGTHVVIDGAGHSVQRRSPAGARAATDFLLR